MPRIAEETLQQVLAATDLVDLIGRVVKLRRSGTNYQGLCPFHQEKTPSFNVNPARNTYHCFGCGAGGNAFRFVMEHDGLTFVEAVKRLGEAAGIRIEEEVFDANAERAAKERQAMLRVHKEIAEWYHALLLRHKIAAPARDYLKSRGITADTAKNWQMGYAPASGDMLREWALDKKFSENILVEAGILAKGGEDSARPGETYPRFRQRLMFPIRSPEGAVIAFSGRVLDPQAKTAKYLNSPETPIFSKSKVLFGLDKASRAIRSQHRVIVCEGQLDVIRVFEAGVENVVAAQGTAFTEFHARMLKRHTEEVVLCFDSDAAGFKAAVRAFTILAPSGLVVKVAPLPQGEDPDSLIRTQGAEVFRKFIDEARDFFDHMIDFAEANQNLADTREKTRFAAEMAAMIRLLDNKIASDKAINTYSLRLGLAPGDFRKQVAQSPKPAAPTGPGQTSESSGAAHTPLPPQDELAITLCHLALTSEAVLKTLRDYDLAPILKFVPGTQLLEQIWKDSTALCDPQKFAGFYNALDEAEQAALSPILNRPVPEEPLTMAKHAIEILEFRRSQRELEQVKLTLSATKPGPEAAAKLNKRYEELVLEVRNRRSRLPPIVP